MKMTKQAVLDYLTSNKNQSKRKMAEDFSVSAPTLSRNLKKMGIVYSNYQKEVKLNATEQALVKVVNQSKYSLTDLVDIFPQYTKAQMVATRGKLLRNNLLNKSNLILTNRKTADSIADQLVKILAKDPDATLQELADTTGTSRPTVKKELHRLIDAGKVMYDFKPRGRRAMQPTDQEITDYLVGKNPMRVADIAKHFKTTTAVIEEYFRSTGTTDWKPAKKNYKNKLDSSNFDKYLSAGLSVKEIQARLAKDGIAVSIPTIYSAIHKAEVPTPKKATKKVKATRAKGATHEVTATPGELTVLSAVHEHPEYTQRELAKNLDMKLYQVQYYLKKLREKKMLGRKDDMMHQVAKLATKNPDMPKKVMAEKLGVKYPTVHRYLTELATR